MLGGLAIGWNSRTIKLLNSWGFDSSLGINTCLEDLGMNLTILNVYGPYQECVPFWECLLNKYFVSNDELILGGKINFSLGVDEY